MSFSALPPWRIKVVRSLLGGVALAIGVLLAIAGWFPQMKLHAKTADWEQIPCRIEKWQAAISGSLGDYPTYSVLHDIQFAYERDGKTWRSVIYDFSGTRQPDLRNFEKEGAEARNGAPVCYVNPQAPQEASFKPARLWIPYSLIGGGGLLALLSLYFLVRTFLPRQRVHRHRRPAIFWVFSAIGLVLAGSALSLTLKFGTADLLWGWWVRGDLVQVTARVEGMDLSQTRGSGRNSHRITYHGKMAYSYEFQDRRWYADRWAFHQSAYNSPNQKEVRDLLASYAVGQAVPCWVHPQRPWMATLNPSVFGWGLLWQLFPLVIAVGALWCFKIARNG